MGEVTETKFSCGSSEKTLFPNGFGRGEGAMINKQMFSALALLAGLALKRFHNITLLFRL